jgi:aryl-alcohol dehydrogenase-like predicted oxidoreductase
MGQQNGTISFEKETEMTVRTDLPTRRLGRTDMELTTVGLGAWAIGGGGWAYGWGPQDDRASIEAIQHAVRRGINWVDTAAVYGYGHSEEIVGQALRELPAAERPLVFTKGGMRWDPDDPMREPRRSLHPASIRFEAEVSLRRLGVERIDLYQFHWPDETGTSVEDSWGEALRLLEEGKVRAIGVSNFDVELLERSEAVGHVDSLQPPFSLVNRSAGGTVIPWAESHGTGVIVYSPMQSGLLSGRFTADRLAAMPEDDWRRRNAEFTPPRLARNLALADWLRPIADSHEVSVGAVAIAWTLAWPGVTGAIVGARSPEQVDGWVDAARIRLSEAELDSIVAAIQATGAGQGPVGPRVAAGSIRR